MPEVAEQGINGAVEKVLRALTEQLLSHQQQSGRTAGSWDSTDRWSKLGGRVYQTALCTLMLEVYYRYLPSYMRPSDDRQAKRGSEGD